MPGWGQYWCRSREVASVEDEHADRVHVPGTNPAASPPDRDVEPPWTPEELESPAPVNGAPAPTGVYHPADRPQPASPMPVPPPPPAVPVPPPALPVPRRPVESP